jgi:hypothetical protein
MNSQTPEDQRDRLIDEMFLHGEARGDRSAVILCAEMIKMTIEHLDRARTTSRSADEQRRFMYVTRAIYNASMIVPELLVPELPRAALQCRRGDENRCSKQVMENYSVLLAIDRLPTPPDLVTLTDAGFEVLRTARDIAFNSEDRALPADECCIVTAYGIVSAIYAYCGSDAEQIVEQIISHTIEAG